MKRTILFLLIVVFFLPGCGNRYEIDNIDSRGRNIIFFGDSITAGMGAGRDEDFPGLIAKMTDAPVINAGVSGDTTRDALKRMDRDVLAHDPLIVVVEFGANDYFVKIPIEETMDNLDRMVAAIQEEGAMVVLMEIKMGLFDQYLAGFKKLARKRNAYLMPNILKGIFGKRELMADQIHPNKKGYQIIAGRAMDVLEPLLSANQRKR